MATRATTSIENQVMTFLNRLRDAGLTNMFGATPYIEQMYDTGKAEARRILTLWMENFNEEGDYNTVED